MIENLPLHAPDASRCARTVAKCHDRLAARRRRIEARHRPSALKAVTIERLLLTGLCVVYLISMAGDIQRFVAMP